MVKNARYLKKQLSEFGFGGYRVNSLVDEHRASLEKALTSGINVIDTSANYSDGGSETLTGETLGKLITAGKADRDNITIVTKGGYIQGTNLLIAKEREAAGNPFSDVFRFNERLWHSVSPDFLEDQIERQLARLDQKFIDTYLLHNPEYSLSVRNSTHETIDDSRDAFYDRILRAFDFLEAKVAEGVLGSYGISSNTFVNYRESGEFVSLERCIEQAVKAGGTSHHFDSVQFPLNLFEAGAVSVKNNSGAEKTVLEAAKELNMSVYINRPLNAVTSAGLVRLAEFKAEEFSEREFIRQIEVVKNMESDLLEEKLPASGFDTAYINQHSKDLSNGRMIEENWKFFGSIEHFNDMIMQTYTPRIKKIETLMKDEMASEHLSEFMKSYITQCHRLMNFVSNYYKLRAAKRSGYINNLVNQLLDPAYHDLTLSQKSLLVISSVSGVDCVLLGMRKEQYVDDALEVMKLDKIDNAEEIIGHVSSEIIRLRA